MRTRNPSGCAVTAFSGGNLEGLAASIFSYEPELVPGLLQTRDYANAVLGIERMGPDELEKRVDLRLEREKVLRRRFPLTFGVILNEAVLCRVVGSPEVMARQLAHLVYAMDWPNVSVRVLPFSAGAHRAMLNGFSYLRFHERTEPDVIYIETRTGAAYLDKPRERQSYRDAMRDLSELALCQDESRALIAARAREFADD